MTEDEARALRELLAKLESRVNGLQEALTIRIEFPIHREWLSVGERLQDLENS